MFEFMIKYILSQIILHVLHLPKRNWFIIHFNNYFWLYQVCDAFILEREKLFYSEKTRPEVWHCLQTEAPFSRLLS